MTAKRYFLDRIENDVAVLVPEGGGASRDIPCARLPSGATEGVWLIQRDPQKADFELDESKTKSVKDDVQNLMDELAGG